MMEVTPARWDVFRPNSVCTGNNERNVSSLEMYLLASRKISKISHNAIFQHALYGSGSKHRAMPRTRPMFLTQVVTNYRQYNPTAPREIHSALFDINKYIEIDKSDALIKAAMCHSQFRLRKKAPN